MFYSFKHKKAATNGHSVTEGKLRMENALSTQKCKCFYHLGITSK